jgi:AraC-like DNA-binding protein
MPSSEVASFDDPQRYEKSVRGTNLRLVVAGRGVFAAKLTKVDLGRVWMQRGHISLPTVTYSALASGRTSLFLQFDPDQAPILNSGMEVSPSEIVRYGTAAEHHYRTSGPYQCGAVSMTQEDFARASKVLVGRELAAPETSRVTRPPPAKLSRLLSLHKAATDLAESVPDILAHPEVSKAIEQELIRAIVACVSDSAPQESASRHGLRLNTMRRFEQLLDSRQDEPLYIPEICAALGVTDRTLRSRCQEHLGMAPHQYLWLRRMNLAKRALERADPRTRTVTEVANDHGFAELGRFAVAFRKLFGESPSTTLRRG